MVATSTDEHTGQAPPAGAWRRRRRAALGIVLGYVAVLLVAQVASFALILAGRLLGGDPTSAFPGIENFRTVDRAVWAGAQPRGGAYEELAERGVRLVVDLRTGAHDDPNEDDPDRLERLGVEYLAMPIRDGHVPSGRQVEQFVDAVRRTDGVVFVHCGGGVGRTSALTSAYGRALGARPPFWDHASLGPHTPEQLWFVASNDTNPLVRRFSEVIDAPRRFWSRVR